MAGFFIEGGLLYLKLSHIILYSGNGPALNLKVNNMIEKNPLFWTPKNPAELAARLESFSGSEKAFGYMVAMWTTNLCAEMLEPVEPVTKPENDLDAAIDDEARVIGSID